MNQRKTFTPAEISSCEDQIAPKYVFLLRAVLTGATYQDMCTATGMPIGTIKSRISRARVALNAALARKAAP